MRREPTWASFCSLPREKERAGVCVCESVCLWASYNYDCVGRLFWYARGCFCVRVLSPPHRRPGLSPVRVREALLPSQTQIWDFPAGSPNLPPSSPTTTSPPPPPVAVSGCVQGELGGVPIHTPSHRWISVRVISGFGGLIQIPLFVNTANIP